MECQPLLVLIIVFMGYEDKAGKVEYPNSDWDTSTLMFQHKYGFPLCMLYVDLTFSNMLSVYFLVSLEGRDLVERMLNPNPEKRIDPVCALKHPWITRRIAYSKSHAITN